MRTSLLAIAAVASMAATGANAADLGGNCCADLEERVAELEATTARKGNKKVKLTVSGHVNENIVFWDDGGERNIYAGQTNLGAQTRFRFVGDAKISDAVTAGYLLEIGTADTRSDSVDQNNDDAAGALAIRHSAWWIAHKQFGKIWVGQTSTATDGITEINVANLAHMGMGNSAANVGGYFARNANGTASTIRMTAFMGGANVISSPGVDSSQIGEGNRQNVIKYESPTIMGFGFATAAGEDDMWDVALRYAGEHHGFKVAGGVGYQRWTDGNNDERNCTRSFVVGSNSDRRCQQLGFSASAMHLATGLFVHGVYATRWDDNVPAGQDDTTSRYYLQGGIEKNWFGIGKTTLFGEYQHWNAGFNGSSTAPTTAGAVATGLASTSLNMWGLGVNQSIDAAAMDLYMNYQHYDMRGVTTAGAVAGAGGGFKDFQAFIAGGIIRF